MSFMKRFVTNLFLERPARNKSYGDYVGILEKKGEAIAKRASHKSDLEWNRRMLSHIIGIERWCQSRIRVALGEPFIEEEYNGYRPSKEVGWEAMKAQFAETRATSVALARELSAENPSTDIKILHNQFGDVSVRGWLHYMQFHATQEAKRLK